MSPAPGFFKVLIGHWWLALGAVVLATASVVGGNLLLRTNHAETRAAARTAAISTTAPAGSAKRAVSSAVSRRGAVSRRADSHGGARGHSGATRPTGGGAGGAKKGWWPPPVVPESGLALLLPLSAGAIFTVSFLLRRRPRRSDRGGPK